MENENSIVRKTCIFAKAIVKKTQDLLETSQLNIKMIQIKSKIEKQYAKIGCCLYNKLKNNNINEVKNAIDGEKLEKISSIIDELYEELEHCKKECTRIKNESESYSSVMNCCNCQQKQFPHKQITESNSKGDMSSSKKDFESSSAADFSKDDGFGSKENTVKY